MKAISAKQVRTFVDIPNVGKAMERDFAQLGLTNIWQLKDTDPYVLYTKLCVVTKKRQDPCVLDTYIAVVDFMNGAPAKPWWTYTSERKKKYPQL